MGGIDEEMNEGKTEAKSKTVSITRKRQPFSYWKVGDTELKLKLKAGMIEKVERKYGNTNILTLVTSGDIPSLSVMLTIIQAAALPWTHGLSYEDVQALYDRWAEEEGGSQMDLYQNVLMPTLAVSGFFTQKQAESIMTKIEEAQEME